MWEVIVNHLWICSRCCQKQLRRYTHITTHIISHPRVTPTICASRQEKQETSLIELHSLLQAMAFGQAILLFRICQMHIFSSWLPSRIWFDRCMAGRPQQYSSRIPTRRCTDSPILSNNWYKATPYFS